MLEEFVRDGRVDDAVFTLRPDYRAMLVTVDGIVPGPSDEASDALLRAAEAAAAKALGGQSAEVLPHVAAWREAYKAFGAKPSRTRNSLEALLRRAGSGLPRVNRLTDIYNAISVLHQLPLGGEDLSRYAGPPRLVRAEGGEPFDTTADGEAVTEHPEPGEVVWCDDAGVTCRRWNWRQARRTQLRDDTTSALFILDVLDPVTDAQVHAATDDLLERLGPDIRSARRLIAKLRSVTPGYVHDVTSGGTGETRGKPAEPDGFWTEFRDAVSMRTVALVIGVLFLQIAFIWSYVGAFHSPSPHRVAVSVTVPGAPASAARQAAARLNALPGERLQATAVATQDEARKRLHDGTDYAAYLVNARGTRDRLLTASAMGSSVQTAVTQIFTEVTASQHRTLSVSDALPLEPGDYHGLTGFYLVIGWLVGGYLVASLLGVAKGSRPANLRRALLRLGSMVPYAIASGLGGAIVVDPVLGALTGHFFSLWLLGALLVASAATVTMALQILFGTVGIGLTVLVFVILGNPSATGAYQQPMLPTFWRTIAYWLPNGAGTDSVRRVIYMSGTGTTGHYLVICAYIVAGTVVTVLAAWLRHRRGLSH